MINKKETNLFEKFPTLTLALLFLFFLLLFDFIAAIFFISKDYNSYRKPSPWYHHDLKANQQTTSIWGEEEYEIYTNSLGFKDGSVREIMLEVPKGKKRIILMGDSFTEGVGMTWENSFAGILDSNNPDIEVLNAAVVSYSPLFYYLKTKYLLENKRLNFDELIVFIDNSDPLNEITYASFEPYPNDKAKKIGISIQQYFFKHSFLYHSISSIILKSKRNKITDHWNRILGEAFVDEVESEENDFLAHMLDWSYHPKAFDRWGKEGLTLCKSNIKKLHLLCKENQIKLTIVIYPWPSVIRQNNANNIQVSYWRNFSQEHHIHFINLYPVFINGENPVEIEKSYFLEGDVHWNKKGHQLIAKKIQEYIDTF